MPETVRVRPLGAVPPWKRSPSSCPAPTSPLSARLTKNTNSVYGIPRSASHTESSIEVTSPATITAAARTTSDNVILLTVVACATATQAIAIMQIRPQNSPAGNQCRAAKSGVRLLNAIPPLLVTSIVLPLSRLVILVPALPPRYSPPLAPTSPLRRPRAAHRDALAADAPTAGAAPHPALRRPKPALP